MPAREAPTRSRRRLRASTGLVAIVALLAVAGVSAGPGRAAASTWTITLAPSTIEAIQATTIKATFWNLGGPDGQQDLGCVRIAIPATMTVSATQVTDAPPGTIWKASKAGLTTVTIKTPSGGDRLPPGQPGASVTAAIIVSAALPGTYTWTANAFRAQDCKDSFNDPAQLTVIVTLTLLPTPKPTTTPQPTSIPTLPPLPTAIPPLPTLRPLPTVPPSSTPTPTPRPTPTPVVTPTPPANATLSPSTAGTPPASSTTEPPGTPGSGSAPGPGGGPSVDPSAGASPAIGAAFVMPGTGTGGNGSADRPTVTLTSGIATPFGGGFAWAVPGLVLSVPGLLLVLVVILAQALGAVAWLPVVRRRIGAFGLRGRDARGDARPGDPGSA